MTAKKKVSEKETASPFCDLLDGWDASQAQKPKKRSISIAGHRTSISLEEPFWDGLKSIALDKGVSVPALVAAIDAIRNEASLSSAIRLFVYGRLVQNEPLASRGGKKSKKPGARR